MDTCCGNRDMVGVARRWCILGLIACAGCGESKQQIETKRDLSYIALAYHKFYADRGRGPHDMEELLVYEDQAARTLPGNAAAQSRARKALNSGNYVVIWDVEILLPAERNSGKILAYHRDVPERGGVVAYQDGSVAVLTREEFERVPKAQPMPESKRQSDR